LFYIYTHAACLFNLCGDGTCVKNGIDFKCQCNEGAANVGNDPKMFCLKKCKLFILNSLPFLSLVHSDIYCMFGLSVRLTGSR
jgi:hypothetical protein